MTHVYAKYAVQRSGLASALAGLEGHNRSTKHSRIDSKLLYSD